MIEFSVNKNGGLEVVQRDFSPTVYLDHWALRKVSEDLALAARLSSALDSRNGTLALSWLNLVEFTKVTREDQIRKAEIFIEANLPRVFFLEIDFFVVIRREDELLAGGRPSPPHADLDFLREFSQFKPTSVKPFTACDLFKVVQDTEFAKRFHDLANAVIGYINALRNEFDENSKFRSAVRRLPSGPQIQRGTRFILRQLVHALLVDKKIKITQNQAIDLLHAVVPVAYCDLVLLDKHWKTQVDRARSGLNKVGLSVPIAKVFSEKANGIDRFFCELESS
jgi:hypothetical protein